MTAAHLRKREFDPREGIVRMEARACPPESCRILWPKYYVTWDIVFVAGSLEHERCMFANKGDRTGSLLSKEPSGVDSFGFVGVDDRSFDKFGRADYAWRSTPLLQACYNFGRYRSLLDNCALVGRPGKLTRSDRPAQRSPPGYKLTFG